MKTFHDQIADFITEQEKHNPRSIQEKIWRDQYWRVKKSFDAWKLTGYKPSNTYIGSAQVQEPIYTKITLKPGNIVLYTQFDSSYVSTDGHTMYSAEPVKPVFKPLEKSYAHYAKGDTGGWPVDKMEPIPEPQHDMPIVRVK